jgi:hypothetical protein
MNMLTVESVIFSKEGTHGPLSELPNTFFSLPNSKNTHKGRQGTIEQYSMEQGIPSAGYE